MKETQVLFRVDEHTLKALDKSLSIHGFKTRNEWFRAQVQRFLDDTRKKELARRLEEMTIEGIIDEEIVSMVSDWRGKKAKR